jgi:hypothetical protein
VNVDASTIGLGEILAQPGVGDLDNPIAFTRIFFQNQRKITTPQKEKA